MPGGATVHDIAVAKIVAATELTKAAATKLMVKAEETPTAIGDAYKTIYKAILEAGG